jgi:hypothetical protein
VERLTLGLNGRTLVFPEGKAYCLVCGRPPSGTRRVWFEDPGSTEPNAAKLGSRGHALGVGINAIRGRIQFDAPLCRVHRRSAVLLSVKATGLFLLTIAVVALGAMALKQFRIPKKVATLAEWLPFIPAILPASFAALYWMRKDRGGLTCDVAVEDGALVLLYKDGLPTPPA